MQREDGPVEAIRRPGGSPVSQKPQSRCCLGLGFRDATAQEGFGAQVGFTPQESTHISFSSFVAFELKNKQQWQPSLFSASGSTVS